MLYRNKIKYTCTYVRVVYVAYELFIFSTNQFNIVGIDCCPFSMSVKSTDQSTVSIIACLTHLANSCKSTETASKQEKRRYFPCIHHSL